MTWLFKESCTGPPPPSLSLLIYIHPTHSAQSCLKFSLGDQSKSINVSLSVGAPEFFTSFHTVSAPAVRLMRRESYTDLALYQSNVPPALCFVWLAGINGQRSTSSFFLGWWGMCWLNGCLLPWKLTRLTGKLFVSRNIRAETSSD